MSWVRTPGSGWSGSGYAAPRSSAQPASADPITSGFGQLSSGVQTAARATANLPSTRNAPAGSTYDKQYHGNAAKFIGGYAALWIILTAIASNNSSGGFAEALALLIAASATAYYADSFYTNLRGLIS